MRERSLKSGLCPPLRGALLVPGTVLGMQRASINTGGIESGVGRTSTSSAVSDSKLSSYRRGTPPGPHPAGPSCAFPESGSKCKTAG